MAIDSSIYFQNQPVDIMGSVDRGLRMADLIGERKQKQAEKQKAQAIDQAYSSALVVNPDGTMSVDDNLVSKNLAKSGFGREALQYQQESKIRKAQEQSSQIDLMKKQRDEVAKSLELSVDENS